MEKFTVTVELTGHATIEVEAIDVLEARETAQAQYKMTEDIEEVMPITVADADGNEVAREDADLLGCRTVEALVGVAQKAFG